MKLKLLIFSMSIFVVLSACSNGNENNQENTQNDTNNEEQQTVENNDQEAIEENGNTDGNDIQNDATDNTEEQPEEKNTSSDDKTLTEPGEYIEEAEYTVELIKIMEPNKTLEISPINVNIQSIKLLKFKDMGSLFKQDLAAMSGKKIDNEVVYIQVMYTSENMEDENVSWNALENIVTDQKEQIGVIANDILLDDSDFSQDFLGQVQKEHTDGVILNKPDINNVKLFFGETYSTDTYETISEGMELEVSF